MAGNRSWSNPVPVSDLASAVLGPVLRRRAGISIELIQSWDELAGPGLSGRTMPEKIVWPRRMSDEDPFEPATLVLACEGAAALHVQHQTGEIIQRVNAFLGFAAIGRIRIVQKPLIHFERPRKPVQRPLTAREQEKLSMTVQPIENSELRASLERLGRSVAARKR